MLSLTEHRKETKKQFLLEIEERKANPFRLFFLLPKAFFKYGIIINNYLKKRFIIKKTLKKLIYK